MNGTIDTARSLGELVAEQPARAAVFERLRLDYCCGGAQTLAEACRRHGLEEGAVIAALDALPAASADAGVEDIDWRNVSIRRLCTHIVTVHHDGLRESFDRIAELLATVVRVHGTDHPELLRLRDGFAGLRAELEPHLLSEERELFPACQALEEHGEPVDEGWLTEHEREHDSAGDALAALRVLAGDYDPRGALCSTHRVLLGALDAFERDLHRHVHEENNILMPRVRDLNRGGTDSLPRCCRAWVAEQARPWAWHQPAPAER